VGGLTASLASRNPNKLRELARALPDWKLELLDAGALPPEEGSTYYENARAKARFGRTTAGAGVWALGEDSGIEVAALDGGPGIRSARWAEDPVASLLEELEGVHGDGRRARYVCELVCVSPELEELRGTGLLEGRIAEEPRGSEGFGYDPIFVPEGETRTVAELGDAWKAEHSHRARAARALLEALAGAATRS
jgi:XTP/dITP diphosphohydrolase